VVYRQVGFTGSAAPGADVLAEPPLPLAFGLAFV
jgi:hypothetical protein